VATGILAGSCSGTGVDCSRGDFFSGLLLGVLAVSLLAGSIVMIKPLLARSDILWASVVRLLAGVAGLLIITAIHPQRQIILGVLKPSPVWKTALPGSFVGNYLAMLAWLAGFKYTLVSVAAILNQLATCRGSRPSYWRPPARFWRLRSNRTDRDGSYPPETASIWDAVKHHDRKDSQWNEGF
jgi:hypothetical protein